MGKKTPTTKKKQKTSHQWRWIAGVIAILIGLGAIGDKPLNGLAYMLIGVVLIPPLCKWAEDIIKRHPSKNQKIGIVAVLLLFAVVATGKPNSERMANDIQNATSAPTEIAQTVQTEPTNTPVVTKKPEPTKVPARKAKIDVTSQIVKKVGDKHRYFFDIRNNDTVPFQGDVSIVLYNNEGDDLGADTFTTKSPIEPGLGDSVYFDIYTGPPSVHGANGISVFKYKITSNKRVINEGQGSISDDYEDLSF